MPWCFSFTWRPPWWPHFLAPWMLPGTVLMFHGVSGGGRICQIHQVIIRTLVAFKWLIILFLAAVDLAASQLARHWDVVRSQSSPGNLWSQGEYTNSSLFGHTGCKNSSCHYHTPNRNISWCNLHYRMTLRSIEVPQMTWLILAHLIQSQRTCDFSWINESTDKHLKSSC